MNAKITDKRGEEKPEKQVFVVYPRCKTCKHFDHFIDANGKVFAETICVIDSPLSQAQIRGVDDKDNAVWGSWHGWPVVNQYQRCGRHEAADAN